MQRFMYFIPNTILNSKVNTATSVRHIFGNIVSGFIRIKNVHYIATPVMSDEDPSSSKKGNPSGPVREDEDDDSEPDSAMDAIRRYFADKLRLVSSNEEEDGPQQKVFEDLTFEGLTNYWKENGFKNIITMVGAGISTSAGIPDFRSPGSGLYDNLQKYNLPHPMAIFEMDYFRENPKPFFTLAKELYPGTFNPTPSHYFVRLLHEKGLLRRHYTQNIDTLERVAGIPEEKLVEAHGCFYTNHCLKCRKLFSMEWMKEQIFADKVPTCTKCNSVVKPDIVFFGENLPEKFYQLPSVDFQNCDLLIIMGTSLEVQPFASLVDRAGSQCVRLLINKVKVGNGGGGMSAWFMFGSTGLQYDSERNTRDIAYIGDCDDGVWALTKALGWDEELRQLIKSETERLAKKDETRQSAGGVETNEDKEVQKKEGSEELEKSLKKDEKSSACGTEKEKVEETDCKRTITEKKDDEAKL